jgi:hypothetical protein
MTRWCVKAVPATCSRLTSALVATELSAARLPWSAGGSDSLLSFCGRFSPASQAEVSSRVCVAPAARSAARLTHQACIRLLYSAIW